MKNRLKTAALLLLAAVAAAVMVAQPAQAFGAGSIQNAGNGLCLQPFGFTEGAPVLQEKCNGLAEQAWIPVLLDGSSRFQFHSVGTGKCMAVDGGAVNLTHVVVRTCNVNSTNQRWSLQGGPIGAAQELRSTVNNTNSHCLDVPQSSTVPHTGMNIFACNNTLAQRWFF
jgi:hypothetical protein